MRNIEEILSQTRLAIPLPEKREDFPPNQLPITPDDRASIDMVCGRVVADEVLRMQRDQFASGGVNPNAVKFLFPDGIEKEMNYESLLKILENHIIWCYRR